MIEAGGACHLNDLTMRMTPPKKQATNYHRHMHLSDVTVVRQDFSEATTIPDVCDNGLIR